MKGIAILFNIGALDIFLRFASQIRRHEGLRLNFSSLVIKSMAGYFNSDEVQKMYETIIDGTDEAFEAVTKTVGEKLPMISKPTDLFFDDFFEYVMFENFIHSKLVGSRNNLRAFFEFVLMNNFDNDHVEFKKRVEQIIEFSMLYTREDIKELPTFKIQLNEQEKVFVLLEMNAAIQTTKELKNTNHKAEIKEKTTTNPAPVWSCLKVICYEFELQGYDVTNRNTHFEILKKYYSQIGKEFPLGWENSHDRKILDGRITPTDRNKLKSLLIIKKELEKLYDKDTIINLINKDIDQLQKRI